MTSADRSEPSGGVNGAMMCMAISANLPPVYLTTFGATFGGSGGPTDEQLGRIAAVRFGALTFGILAGGPLADRWGPDCSPYSAWC